jgi:hypothetical protein
MPIDPDPADVTIIRRVGDEARERGGIAIWEIVRSGLAELSGITNYEDAKQRGDQIAKTCGVALWYVHDPQRPNRPSELLANYRTG